jgi:hypothetical protein
MSALPDPGFRPAVLPLIATFALDDFLPSALPEGEATGCHDCEAGEEQNDQHMTLLLRQGQVLNR